MTLEGWTALSLEMRTRRSTPWAAQARNHVERALHVVSDGIFDVVFHQGDMLVGGGMEDDLGAVAGEDGVETARGADVGDERDKT